MIKHKVLLNGYGRMGRLLHRIALERETFEVVGINSRSTPQSHAHLFKHDSTYGLLDAAVNYGDDYIEVNGTKIEVFTNKDPGEIDITKLGADYVAECTGKFKDRENCEKQLKAGTKKVVISAPGKNEDVSIVMGVNQDDYNNKKHNIVSNASCTTNCLAPTIKVLNETFGVVYGHMTTIHAITKSQNILDGSHKKCMRRARTSSDSFIPTTTGASKAIGKIFPELDGKIKAVCVRVPFSTVSLIDLVVLLDKNVTVDEVNKSFKSYSNGALKGILGVSDEPLVSIDYKGEKNSCVIDTLLTSVVNERYVKIMAWYDNEWGYIERLADLIEFVGANSTTDELK